MPVKVLGKLRYTLRKRISTGLFRRQFCSCLMGLPRGVTFRSTNPQAAMGLWIWPLKRTHSATYIEICCVGEIETWCSVGSFWSPFHPTIPTK